MVIGEGGKGQMLNILSTLWRTYHVIC